LHQHKLTSRSVNNQSGLNQYTLKLMSRSVYLVVGGKVGEWERMWD